MEDEERKEIDIDKEQREHRDELDPNYDYYEEKLIREAKERGEI